MKLLVATNNFWLGGRETFIDTWLTELAVPASLIASSVDRDVPGVPRFGDVVECGTEPYDRRLRAWLAQGGELIRRTQPAVIWAHHFELLPAWLLSRVHGVPLLTTFHGPLIGDRRPNELMQALGMTLAIHRGDLLTGVSEEVLDGLRALNPAAAPRLLPNTVSVGDAADPPRVPPRRFVLLTRRDKLEHIRQAALLFASYARRVSGCSLVIADGDLKLHERHRRSIRGALRQLGGKWAVGQGFDFLRRLGRMDFIGWTADARAEIRAADAVLGMGRVVLEAIAERRPAVLVGYRDVHGLVTAANFDTFRRTNFSGRGMPPRSRDEIVRELLALRGTPDLSSVLDSISSRAWAERLRELLRELGNTRPAPDRTANELSAAIERGAGAAELFNVAVRTLAPAELETLYRVTEG